MVFPTCQWVVLLYNLPTMTLTHQVAVITGGSKGIGREIAIAFAREGCSVVLVARGEAALRQTASDIKKETGKEVMVFALDVTDTSALLLMVQSITATLGQIHILVHAAAAVGPIGAFEDNDPEDWEQTMMANIMGTYHVARAVIPSMIAHKRGVIITFAGGGAFGARARFSAYSVSKAAVVRLTDAMSQELQPYGITVNGISPGQVNTDMFEAMLAAGPDNVGQAGWTEFQKRLETGGDPIEDVGKLALFLVSDAGRQITGRVISVQWDPWKQLPQYTDALMASDIYTMRRIKPEDYGKHWN